jgi:hypothetical protein
MNPNGGNDEPGRAPYRPPAWEQTAFTITGGPAGPASRSPRQGAQLARLATQITTVSSEDDDMDHIISGISGGRGWQRRAWAGILAAALAGIAVLAVACGSGLPAGSGPGSGPTPYQHALAYARCMRSHGVPRFPDPTSQGLITYGPVDIHSAQYLSANKICQQLLPAGSSLTTAQKRQDVTQALEFARCIRSHGVPGFADPAITGSGAAVGFRVPRADQNSPQFQAAVHACRNFEPGMGGLMAGGGTP